MSGASCRDRRGQGLEEKKECRGAGDGRRGERPASFEPGRRQPSQACQWSCNAGSEESRAHAVEQPRRRPVQLERKQEQQCEGHVFASSSQARGQIEALGILPSPDHDFAGDEDERHQGSVETSERETIGSQHRRIMTHLLGSGGQRFRAFLPPAGCVEGDSEGKPHPYPRTLSGLHRVKWRSPIQS
jgi:hypothetical protein